MVSPVPQADMLSPHLNGVCACGKVWYLSRKAARHGARRAGHGKGAHVYRCRLNRELWHVTTQSASTVTRHRDKGES
jgi:hypothetical protein